MPDLLKNFLLLKIYEKFLDESSFIHILVIASQNKMFTIPHDSDSINFEKFFLSGVIVSVNKQKKDIKVTFVYRPPGLQ